MSWNVGLLGRRGEREVCVLGRGGGQRWGDGPSTLPPPQPLHSRPEQRMRSSRPVPLQPRHPAVPFPRSDPLRSNPLSPEGMFYGQRLSRTSSPARPRGGLCLPSHTRPAKSEARVLDLDAVAQGGGGTGLEATAAQNAARGLEPRSVGARPGPQSLRLAERRADLALTSGGGAGSVSRSPLFPASPAALGAPSP